jgi:DNA ligase D-like protein (predicted polymerase)
MYPVAGKRITVDVEGREVSLSNLDKVLYPDAGFTKGEVIDYYTRIAPVLLPHLADRALTVKRYPNGVDAPFFFEKNAAKGTPDWVRTVSLPVPGSTKNRERIDYVVVEELATLVWLANLAAIELHVPQWRLNAKDKPVTDQLVFDLDPGKPAGVVECCRVAELLREVLDDQGLTATAKTSGSKGMQVSVPTSSWSSTSASSTPQPTSARVTPWLLPTHGPLALKSTSRQISISFRGMSSWADIRRASSASCRAVCIRIFDVSPQSVSSRWISPVTPSAASPSGSRVRSPAR